MRGEKKSIIFGLSGNRNRKRGDIADKEQASLNSLPAHKTEIEAVQAL